MFYQKCPRCQSDKALFYELHFPTRWYLDCSDCGYQDPSQEIRDEAERIRNEEAQKEWERQEEFRRLQEMSEEERMETLMKMEEEWRRQHEKKKGDIE